ncbi:MAG: NAD(P)-binding domain-containing protein [Acidobacteriota bacterium]
MSTKRIAIIGAGPVGLEAALCGRALGHDVQVYERGRIGQNMTDWGHVTLFSSWALNHSSLGASLLRDAGAHLPADADYLTGAEHVERYLKPLTRTAALEGRIHERTEVVQVGRAHIGKKDLIGGPRQRHPFRLLLEGMQGEEITEADVVLDCSGTYGNHNWMGNGNIPALGERALQDRIAYELEDITGVARERYEGRRVLLVGSGHSAATALDALTQLPAATVVWVCRNGRDRPLAVTPNDPLPERARLSEMANALAAGSNSAVQFHPDTEVEQVESRGESFEVSLGSKGTVEKAAVHRILAHVGYSPDNRLYRELQVHECYASFGPMKLSAALLGESSADCLAQTSKGPEVLKNPEPDFYILGAKSYGRNSNFLIRIGLQQVREAYTLIESQPDLNLYAS